MYIYIISIKYKYKYILYYILYFIYNIYIPLDVLIPKLVNAYGYLSGYSITVLIYSLTSSYPPISFQYILGISINISYNPLGYISLKHSSISYFSILYSISIDIPFKYVSLTILYIS